VSVVPPALEVVMGTLLTEKSEGSFVGNNLACLLAVALMPYFCGSREKYLNSL